MGFVDGEQYVGEVGLGSALMESSNGTLGFQVNLKCPEGRTSHTIWLTPKNRENAIRDFKVLGVSEEQLKDPAFLDTLGVTIAGRPVTFGMKSQTYNGKSSLRVAWIRGKSAPRSDNIAKSAAAFFADTKTEGDF